MACYYEIQGRNGMTDISDSLTLRLYRHYSYDSYYIQNTFTLVTSFF